MSLLGTGNTIRSWEGGEKGNNRSSLVLLAGLQPPPMSFLSPKQGPRQSQGNILINQ